MSHALTFSLATLAATTLGEHKGTLLREVHPPEVHQVCVVFVNDGKPN
jgi:hypothetical protein